MLTDIFILGASGFVGSAVVRAAVDAGLRVGAWARTDAQANTLKALGVRATAPSEIPPARVVLDLVQPKLPDRLSERAFVRAAAERVDFTRSVLKALPKDALLVSVSGTDDFDDDVVSHRSPFGTELKGFAHIGLSVRAELLRARVPFASMHLGTVYGPGKLFAASLFPKLASGKLPIVGDGSNRLPLIHVEDAARALVHVAMRADAAEHPWILTDGTSTTQRQLFELCARLLGGPRPRSVPRWVASVVSGSVAASFISRDVPTDNSALLSSGFTLRYPTIEKGVPAALAQLEAA